MNVNSLQKELYGLFVNISIRLENSVSAIVGTHARLIMSNEMNTGRKDGE